MTEVAGTRGQLTPKNSKKLMLKTSMEVKLALTSEVMLPTGVMKLSQVCEHVLCASRL